MRKTFPLLFSLILSMASFRTANAQDGQIPATISVTIDSYQSIQELPQPSWVIKEGDSPLSIQDILNGDLKDGQVLEVLPDEVVIKQFEKYWFAIEFVSEVDLQNWLLHIKNNSYTGFGWNSNFSEIKSFAVRDGQIGMSGTTGYFVPPSQRDYKSRHTQSLLNLSLASGTKLTLWVHISKNYFITSSFPPLTIYDPFVALPEFAQKEEANFWLGTFFVTWILSLIIFLYLRDRTSVWFFIFTTSLFVDTLSNLSYDPLTTILYPENPGIGIIVGWGTSVFMMVFLLQFARLLINLPIKNRKLDKVMYLSNWVFFVASITLFYLFFHYENLAFITTFMLVFGITFLGSGTIYLFLKGALSKILGLALLFFVIPNLIPLPFVVNYIPIGSLLLTVTIGVAYRIKMLFEERMKAEKEKKDLLTDQNTLLEKQVAERTAELNNSLDTLKSTQAQLIQSEKMASLGELTAGIAHEIQNPLNFVNNFSEVSKELLDEMKEELAVGSVQSAVEIVDDISQNLDKIHHHGKRADAIVKGMLEHSKRGSGQKEPTNLNALAEEFVRLSFRAFLAKEPYFNCELKTDLDPDIPVVSVIPQDIEKVLHNVLNNAFYAVNEKAKENADSYKPEVIVSTKKSNIGVEIAVKDNGPGIPDAIKEKIFQPFFTTKPTGSGTGLGLSLSYDIVKAHGGELKLETEPGRFTELIVSIPLKSHT